MSELEYRNRLFVVEKMAKNRQIWGFFVILVAGLFAIDGNFFLDANCAGKNFGTYIICIAYKKRYFIEKRKKAQIQKFDGTHKVRKGEKMKILN